MKLKNRWEKFIFPVCCCVLLGHAACVNEISTDVEESDVPITFSLKIKPTSVTKASGSSFEEGDRIGLYAMVSGNSVSDNRYIDNLLLTCSEADKLVPERVVFYPEGNVGLDFVAYYPYSKEGVSSGSSLIPVALRTDQSQDKDYSNSDFMTASRDAVVGSDEAVVLEFEHKLSKVKIALVPMGDESAEDMLEANPKFVAIGFCTQASYNLAEDSFEDFKNPADIVSHGEWKVEDGKLVGHEFILLPQNIDGSQSFQMELNGRIYTCPLPSMEKLDKNCQYQLDIKVTESDSHVLSGVVASIKEWPAVVDLEDVTNDDSHKTVHLSVLSFETSNVYRVHMNGREVAEICKEYLFSDALASVAITSYPIGEDGKADLTRGTVLQLLDSEDNNCGGTLSWDVDKNTFQYTAGDKPSLSCIYFDESGVLCTTKPEQPASVNVIAHTLRDLRTDLREYPIVKIGTQYWMRENLKADRYRNGSKLTAQDELNGNAGYFYVSNYVLYFYNGGSLLAGELSPEGWRIPTLEDWDRLNAYVKGDVSLLKNGKWEILPGYDEDEDSSEIQPATNETMFNLRASGIWQTDGHVKAWKMVGFWSWDAEKDTIPEKTVFFVGQSNEMVKDNTMSTGHDFYKGLAIRCEKAD